jgi:pimeloyl-ACP methyl ester carboxylesterase
MHIDVQFDPPRPREGYVRADGAWLYCRDIGEGPPVIVLHGGPDFDHTYLLPEFDRLADSCHLIYFDQRGRGRSAEGVQPDDVTIASEVDDILPSLRSVDAPALIIHGEADFIPVQIAADIDNAFQNAQFRTLPECGHFPFLESSDQFHHLISDFLRSD